MIVINIEIEFACAKLIFTAEHCNLKRIFYFRYSPHGRRTTEENIRWDRLRAPPVDTPPHVLHASDCLSDLKPGDHIEIQWRRKKEFPHGVFLNQYAFMRFPPLISIACYAVSGLTSCKFPFWFEILMYLLLMFVNPFL